jgi:hypothetical protein
MKNSAVRELRPVEAVEAVHASVGERSRWFPVRRCDAWISGIVIVTALSFIHGAAAQGLGIAENKVGARRHLDYVGKPCLTTSGVARPLATNPRILNHSVSLENHCFEPIKAKVCYYGSDECTDVTVPPHGIKEQVIGVFPAMQMFRYEVKESF